MRKGRIILWVPEYPPYHIGWWWAVFEALAKEYSKLWHEVMVIYGYYPTKHGFESIKKYTKDNIHFIQVPLLPTPSFVPFLKTVLPTGFRNLGEINAIIKEFNPTIAHLHGYGLIFINQLAKIIWTNKIPYIYTLHGAPVSANKKWWPIMRAYNLYKNTRGKAILKHASDITAVSQYTIDNFTEFHPYKDKIRVVPNGIYPQEFSKKIDYNIYDQYNLPKWSTIFLSIGRIEWIKWFDQFIRMIPHLVKEWIDVRYCIAGKDNGYKKTLDGLSQKLWVSNRIYYLGFVWWDDKLSMLQNSDYVVVPSHVENRPAVPLEAMCVWKTPIVNNAWWMIEQVIDGLNWLIIDFSKSEDYVKILWKEINKSAMLSTAQYYNWEEVIKKYLENIFYNLKNQ